MTKGELIRAVAKNSGVTLATAESVINAFTAEVSEAVLHQGEELRLPGFGTFRTTRRSPRPYNLGGGVSGMTKETSRITFKAYEKLEH